MADTALVLGSITFQDFEIPSEINFGGKQALSVKKLVGGARVVDALGQDDDEIKWSGRLQGPGSIGRALAIDELRKGGQPQPLSVFGLSYTVTVSDFVYRVQRAYQVLYEIELTVVQDNTLAPQAPSATLDDVVGSDMAGAGDIAPGLTDPTVAPAIAALQSAITAAGTLQGATLTALSPVTAAAAAASAAVATAINAADPTILNDAGSVAGIVQGGSPTAMIATFQAQSAAVAQVEQLQELAALTGRMQTNLAQATG